MSETLSIKDAYRYQKKLSDLLSQLRILLGDSRYLYSAEEHHNRQEVIAKETNTQVSVPMDKDYPVSADKLIRLMEQMVEEKRALSLAVETAKKSLLVSCAGEDVPLDCALEYNNLLRENTINTVSRLADLKPKERTGTRTGNLFDNEGRLMQYSYPVITVYTIDYDRKKMVAMKKKLMKQADEISENIERAMLEKCVRHAPKYGMHVTLDEILS